MESTATLVVKDGENEGQMRRYAASETPTTSTSEPITDSKNDFFGVSTKPIYVLVVPAVVLLVCALLGLITWSLGKAASTQRNDGLDDANDFKYFGDARGPANTMFPLPPKSVKEATVPPKDAAPVARSAIALRASKTRPNALKAARIKAPAATAFNPCTTQDCRSQADYLKKTMNFTADPCHDLYNFVCGNYWVHRDGPYAQAENAIRNATISALAAERVPAWRQSAWQKAAAIFQACFAFISTYRNELEELKALMVSLNLDLLDLRASRTVDPVDMVVRLSLDVGIPAVLEFRPLDDTFIDEKRVIQFRISAAQEAWHEKRSQLLNRSSDKVSEYISDMLLLYRGYEPYKHASIASTLYDYEEKPEWADAVAKYTRGLYSGFDMIQHQTELVQAVSKLLREDSKFGKDGFRAMLAWNLFHSLSDYALPLKLAKSKDKQKQDACYDIVSEAMGLAMTSRYLRSMVGWSAMSQGEKMFSKLKDAFEPRLRGSSLLNGTGLALALRKLRMMNAYIGSPAQGLDESSVDKYYADFPDMSPTSRFLDAWFEVLSARAHQKWSDQAHILFNISKASPSYVKANNSVVIPAAALLPIFFYADGNPALNYGGLGDAMAHQIMNAYDIVADVGYCYTPETNQRFRNKLDCLRESHRQAGHAWSRPENRSVVWQNVGDLVGTTTAYEAFQSLPSAQRTQTLPGLSLTAEQLYFVGHCMTTCNFDDLTPRAGFAGPRARCNVPVMNMDAFSAAFGCSAGTRMNQGDKCSFWK